MAAADTAAHRPVAARVLDLSRAPCSSRLSVIVPEHALPSPGSLRVCRSPASLVLWRAPTSPHPSCVTPLLASLSATESLLRCSMSPPWWSCHDSPGPLKVDHPCRCSEMRGSPRFLADPCALAVLFDPGGRADATVDGPLVLPASPRMESATAIAHFRGSITRPVHLLSTLRSRGRPRHARLATGWAVSLGRAGLSPAGSDAKFRCRD